MKNGMELLSGKTVIAIAHRLDSIRSLSILSVAPTGVSHETSVSPLLRSGGMFFLYLHVAFAVICCGK